MSDQSSEEPQKWKRAVDRDRHLVYYYNIVNKQTSWYLPPGAELVNAVGVAEGDIEHPQPGPRTKFADNLQQDWVELESTKIPGLRYEFNYHNRQNVI